MTYGLIVANVAAFGIELAAGAGATAVSPAVAVALGANFGPLTTDGEPWRLLTSMFLHFGVLHIGMNMVCLYQAQMVERVFHRAEFLALYLASGLLGALASVATHPMTVSIGASGAVFGIFGAFAAVLLATRSRVDPAARGAWRATMRSLGTFFALNLVLGLADRSIDLAAHLGGLATGFVAAYALAKTARPMSRHYARALVVVGLAIAVAACGLHALHA